MTLTYFERKLGTVTASDGNTVSFPLPREHLYSRLLLREIFPASAANYVASAEDLMITRIEIIANGQLVIKSYSWSDLEELNKYVNKVSNVNKIAGTVAKTAFFSSAYVDFSLTEDDLTTLLPSYSFTSLDLKLTFSALATRGGDANAPTVDIYSREILFTPELKDLKYAINKETTLSQTFAATGDQSISLPLGNVYRRIFSRTFGGPTLAAGVGADDAVTNVEIAQDSMIVHKRYDYLGIKAANKLSYQLETYVANLGAGVQAGSAMWNFDWTGDTGATVDTAAFASWTFKVTVASVATSSVTVRLIPQEIILPRE